LRLFCFSTTYAFTKKLRAFVEVNNLTNSYVGLYMGNRVLKNPLANVKQRRWAKAGKIMGILTICLMLVGTIWGLLAA
jgi:hypothetical protein